MEALSDFAKILLPAGAVLYAMYLVVKSFLTKEMEKKILDIRMKNTETILPVRLQAYERMCLFLERISPNNLVLRLNQPDLTAKEFQHILINEIRQEFNHNVSQQVYLSDESWSMVKSAMEEVITIINISIEEVNPNDKSVVLAKKIIEKLIEKNNDPVGIALKKVKDEIRSVF